jgi:hypothetical protein
MLYKKLTAKYPEEPNLHGALPNLYARAGLHEKADAARAKADRLKARDEK